MVEGSMNSRNKEESLNNDSYQQTMVKMMRPTTSSIGRFSMLCLRCCLILAKNPDGRSWDCVWGITRPYSTVLRVWCDPSSGVVMLSPSPLGSGWGVAVMSARSRTGDAKTANMWRTTFWGFVCVQKLVWDCVALRFLDKFPVKGEVGSPVSHLWHHEGVLFRVLNIYGMHVDILWFLYPGEWRNKYNGT